MEPQLPTPRSTPESGPAHFQGGETFEGLRPVESQPERAPEQAEKQESHEQHRDGPAGDPAAVVAPAPVLPPLPTITPVKDDPVSDVTNPATAADVELIEKEWVEKAKKVVSETKHDPYLQGQQVSRLQADYLKKRYGKSIRLPTDGS